MESQQQDCGDLGIKRPGKSEVARKPTSGTRGLPKRNQHRISLQFLYERLKRPCGNRLKYLIWRRERDSNPRRAFDPYTLSRGAPSTTRPSLRSLSGSPGADFRAGLRPPAQSGRAIILHAHWVLDSARLHEPDQIHSHGSRRPDCGPRHRHSAARLAAVDRPYRGRTRHHQ